MTDDHTTDPYAADAALEAASRAAVDTLDDSALAMLRALHEAHDPVPASLVERVTFAISLDHLEAEVALLQRTATPELVSRADLGVEDAQKAHSVTFTSDSVTTMVTITPVDTTSVRLDGWAAPGAGLRVELRVGEASHHAVADEDGRFVFERVGHGMAQLVLRPAEATGPDAADPDDVGRAPAHRPVITPAIEI